MALFAEHSAVTHISSQQNANRVTIKANNLKVDGILDLIKQQAGVNFVVNATVIANLGNRNLDVTNATLAETMTQLLAGTPYDYTIVGNNVTIVARQSQGERVTITGKVTDSSGLPLVGVTVIIKNTKLGVATNSNGEYSISASKGQHIVFSYVGKATREVRVEEQNVINVVLENVSQKLDDVVVTGIFRKSTETFTGSVVSVSAEELRQFGSRNVLTTLRNLDPSFNILENNDFGSDPNRLPDVQIRGSSSIPNVDELQDNARSGLNTPLIILDGFESSLQTLYDMNENEIASITLLKDASATAIYGSRGANGVIVIETKIPESGKLRISYSANLNLEMPDITSYNLMDAAEKLDFEYLVGRYGANNSEYLRRQQYNYLLAQVHSGVDTDWLSKPLQVGIGHKHNLRIEGGDKTFRYSAAVQYNLINGVMKESKRENFNGTITLSYSLKNVRFTNNTIIGLNGTGASPYGTFSEYARMNPYFSPYDENGNIRKAVGVDGEGATLMWGLNGITNPLWNSTLNTYNKTNSSTITNNFAIDWNVTPDLTVRGKLGLQKSIGGNDIFYPAEHTMFASYSEADLLRKGQYINGNSRGNSIDASLTVNYMRLLGEKHMIFAGLNFNARQHQSSSTSITAEGFVNENLDFLSMALQYAQGGKPSGTESKTRSIGLAGNFNYSYDNRYYIDFTITGDGNSAFGSDRPFASFWSLGAGWNLHNESFLDNENISRLKLRGSVGTNGSQSFSAYQSLTTYQYYTSDRYFTWLGADIKNLGNPDLKWQQKMNYNLGVEIELFDRRLLTVFDTYIETTRDQISSINVPSSTGFTSYIENIGQVENRGFELKITGILLRNTEQRFMWAITASMAHNKNEIKKLSQAMKDAQASIEADTGSNPYVIYKEGHSMDAIWVVRSLGIDPSTGREQYLDINGNPTWTWSASNLAECGISQPKYYGNINTNLRWRNLLLTASFGYRTGGQIYNSTLIEKVENADYKYNLDKRILSDRWQNPGDNTLFKSVYLEEATKKTSRFVQDENTFRCQSMSLIYDFNPELIKRWSLSNLSLKASMDDLLYISSVKRERGTSYPFSRQLSFTLSATF